MSYGWYGDLPAPTVSGSTALYAEVLPDIDLKVTVSDEGFEILLVIKSAAAGADVSTIDFPVTVTDLVASEDGAGNTQFQDTAGTVLGTEPAPLLWDASIDQYSGDPHTAQAGSQWDATDMSGSGANDAVQHVVLPTAFLADPGTQYPVTVDPTLRDYTPALAKYAYVDQHFPDQQYYDTTLDSSRLHVGAEPDSTLINRAYWAFPGSPLAGQHVFEAHFDTTEAWAWSCTPKVVDLYTSNDWGNTLTYNNQPGGMSGSWATANVAKGYNQSACSGGAVGFDVTSLITALAAQQRSVFSLILRAHDETDVTAWKKFNASTSLEVQYNSYPDAPTGMGFSQPPASCGGYPGPAVNNAVQDLRLAISENDADNQGVDVHVHVVDASTNVNVLPASTYPAGYISTGSFNANGLQPSLKILRGSLPQGRYAWYANGYDGIDTGPQSGVCYFTVDDTPPPPPALKVAGLPPSAVGKLTNMRITSAVADNVVRFEYWWTSTAKTVSPSAAPVSVSTGALPACGSSATANSVAARFACPSGGVATVVVAPPDSPATLWVASIDSAQNISTATGYQFWAPGDFTAFANGHTWVTDSPPGTMTSTQVPDSATASGAGCGYSCAQPLVLHAVYSNDPSNPKQGDPGLTMSMKLNGTTDAGASATTAGPMVDTSKAFTVSAWVRPAALGSVQTAVSQAAGSGQTVSGFYLQLNASNQWQMCVSSSLTSAGFSGDCATAPGTVTSTGNWAFLTGVWDPGNQQVRLYVNGGAPSTNSHLSTPTAPGAFTVGTSISGSNHYWFHGWISDVSIVPGAADSVQQGFLQLQCPVTNLGCRLLPGD
ncbi:MAG: LamG-like jellyroll fold domain-containing protein [Jatrophihabitantaceae bacterium]